MGNGTVTLDRFTSADLALLPDDGNRYEIIEGELYVSKQPSSEHQHVCHRCGHLLESWNERAHLGVVIPAPGLVFAEDDDVVPDLVWISNARYARGLDSAGHLFIAPELAVEVLSPGRSNEHRDRQAKLALYSRRGVDEYWIISWLERFVEVYRRDGTELKLTTKLFASDTLESPLLPGFACLVKELFTLQTVA
jgi:Uma2 family endonuclease